MQPLPKHQVGPAGSTISLPLSKLMHGRVLAIEILQTVRSIAAVTAASDVADDELPPARVMDIMDETGPDVLQRLHQDFRFKIQVRTCNGVATSALQLTCPC